MHSAGLVGRVLCLSCANATLCPLPRRHEVAVRVRVCVRGCQYSCVRA